MKAILSIWLLALSALASGQSLHNSSSIFIPASVKVFAGDVNNDGFIQNNGVIEITGDWNNKNVYQGTGVVGLAGADQQFDNNNQMMQNLVVDGGGRKSLHGKLIINSSIEFASGIVTVGNGDTLLLRDDAKIKGGSFNSFVDGPLTIEGTGYRFFPVGADASYYPIALTNIQGLNPFMQITARKDLPEIKTDGDVAVDRSVYWQAKNIKGKFDGSPVSAPHRYEIAEPERIVFVNGNAFDSEFTIIDNDGLESNGASQVVVSKTSLIHSIIAVGATPEKPIIPGYLSTTMSPNAMNADNRLIKFFGEDVKRENFHLQIFNRWGNSVFETRSIDDMSSRGWDGQYANQLLPAGAYPYQLTYVDRRGKEESRRGFITIIY